MILGLFINVSCRSTINNPLKENQSSQYKQIDTISRAEPDQRGIITYDTYQILIDVPFEYGKIVIITDEGCGVETEFNLALGDPYFSYTSPSFEQVNEIPARENITFIDE